MGNKDQNKRSNSNSEEGKIERLQTHTGTHTHNVGCTTDLEMLATPRAVTQLQCIYVKLEQRTDNVAGKRQKPSSTLTNWIISINLNMSQQRRLQKASSWDREDVEQAGARPGGQTSSCIRS